MILPASYSPLPYWSQMEMLVGLVVLLLAGVAVGALFGWIAFFRLQKLNERVADLQMQVKRMSVIERLKPEPAAAEEETAAPVEPERARPIPPEEPETGVSREEVEPVGTRFDETDEDEPQQSLVGSILASLKGNWMIWLGGVCVGLAGIFLVRYSIESGLLGPAQRITAALVSGVGLHVLAEWLRRRAGGYHPAFAALAAGASITLYAALLAALHLYQLLNPGLVFVCLAVISLLTMLLALRDGPVLAILGILGAYVVPVLVSTGSSNIVGALAYSLIISAAALLLMRYVYRPWLWYGTLAGGLGWWLISLSHAQAHDFRGPYLAALAYGFLVMPEFDWLLGRKEDESLRPVRDRSSTIGWRLQPLPIGLALIVVAQAVSIAIESFSSLALLTWAPLLVLLIQAAAHRPSISYLPWFSLVVQWFAWLYCGIDFHGRPIGLRGLDVAVQNQFLLFLLGMAAVYSGMTWLAGRRQEFCQHRFALVVLAPVLWLALGYLLVTDLSVSWEWSFASFALGIGYIVISNVRLLKDQADPAALWLILGGHFAVSLAAAMFCREASLTLVFSVQVISLVYLRNRFNIDGLQWLVKAVLALVVVRLTLNPWLLSYPKDIHWSLWTYGGAMLCCGFAAWLARPQDALKKWLEAASLQLAVLFFAAETRYWLYNGDIFTHDYTLTEAALNTTLWAALGLVYYYRSQSSELLRGYYLLCSRILLVLALVNYGVELTLLNPLWSSEQVGVRPIWNLLLPAYGSPVVMALACFAFYDPRFKRVSAICAGGALFIFVSMEIRHLWQPLLRLHYPVDDGELYSYSAVWLVMAVVSILMAAHGRNTGLYKAGMGLLLLVIAKIFLIDMADLAGLLRVASFMGLGLSLLGIAYLYQRISRKTEQQQESAGD